MTLFSPPVPGRQLDGAFAALAPVVIAVFLGFLSVGIPLAALSLEMRNSWQSGSAVIGIVIGLQSVSTLLTRHQAGTLCDRHGPRLAVLVGLPLAAMSGVAYVFSGLLAAYPAGSLAILVMARLLMGLGESLFLTGLMSWGIARMGPTRTGKVMSWTGIAIYAALGIGAPIGLALQARFGFAGVGIVTALAPLVAWVIAIQLPAVQGSGGLRVPFYHVLVLIWRPGLVLALATVPFATMAAFLSLDFAANGWPQAGVALFGFGAAYVFARLLASGLADRIGAARVATGSLAIEAIGQALLWFAPVPSVAIMGATLTGLGFSLVFPAMGVLATRAVPSDQRGRAVGNFIAFADIALGVTGPTVGLVIQWFGVSSAFLAGVIATLIAVGLLTSVQLSRSV